MGDISNEPSMEEILSSIKKIIAEDTARAVTPARRAPVRASVVDLVETRVAADDVVDEAEDVFELTEASASKAAELVSAKTAEQSRSALDSLSRMVVKPEVAGSDTLEGVVRDMLRPMLKDWLDANLPDIVKGVVSCEVARISGRNL
jgi:uncharacterized protein